MLYHITTSIKTIKLKDEVGMTGSKSTQTRFARDNKHLLYIPTLAFLGYYAPINVDVFVEHRLQLSLNLRDSPGFLAIVPRPGRLFYNCIIGPGRGPDTSINTVVIVQLITYWW